MIAASKSWSDNPNSWVISGLASVVFSLENWSYFSWFFLCWVIWDCILDTVNIMLHRLSYNSQETWMFPTGNRPIGSDCIFCLLWVGCGSSLSSVPLLCCLGSTVCMSPARVLWALESGFILLQFSKPRLCCSGSGPHMHSWTVKPWLVWARMHVYTHTHSLSLSFSLRGFPIPAPLSEVFSLLS